MTNEDKRELRRLAKQGLSFKYIRDCVDCADSTIRQYIKVFSKKAPPKPVEVKYPEYDNGQKGFLTGSHAWNSCIEEMKRLNQEAYRQAKPKVEVKWPDKQWIKGHENTCIIKNETIDQCIEAYRQANNQKGE